MMFNWHVDATIAISPGGHAGLGKCAHFPILPVYQVKKLDSICRIEVRALRLLTIKEPVTRHSRAVRFERSQGMDNDMVIEQIQQQVGVENNPIVTPQIFRHETWKMRTIRL